MIPLVIIFAILCSASFMSANLFNKKFEETIAINIMSIILIIYFSGIFGFLKQGVYIVVGLSIIAYLYTIFKIIKNKNLKETMKNIFTPGFAIFVIFLIFLIIVHRGRLCVNWDEFSHWGDVVKAMFNINDFSTSSESMSMFKSYPPAMSIFQYFWMVIGGSFKEWYLYVSYQIFAVSLFLPMLKNIRWKEWPKIIIIAGVILFIPIIVYSGYYEAIYIDAILGIMFGYVLSNILLVKEYDRFEILKLILSLSVLVLLKDMGMLFAVIALIIMILDAIFIRKNIFKLKSWSKQEKKEFSRLIIKILVIVLVVILVKMSWNREISINNVEKSFGGPIFSKKLSEQIIGKQEFETYKKETVYNFASRLSNSNFLSSSFIKINYYNLVIILSIILYLIYIRQKNNQKDLQFNKRFALTNIIIIIGLLGYTLCLLLLYITKFSEYEAVRLASFERYMGTYFLAVITYIALIYRDVIKNVETLKVKEITAILLLILVLFTPIDSITQLILVRAKSTIATRSFYNEMETKVKSVAKDNNKKIYLISQNTSGYDYWVSKFVIRPNSIQHNLGSSYSGWSIGKSYSKEDIWTVNITVDKWKKILMDQYDYVYILKQDSQFIEQFGSIFKENNSSYIINNSLYVVDKQLGRLVLVN